MFSFSAFPLTIFHVIGALAATVFVTLSGFSIFCRMFTDQAIPGWTSHILTGSFFGALNALGISVLGEYVIRIYDQVRGRPQYVVDRKVNFSPAGEAGDAADDGPYVELLEQTAQLLKEGTIPEAQPGQEERRNRCPRGQSAVGDSRSAGLTCWPPPLSREARQV